MKLPQDEYSVFFKVTPKDDEHPLNELERVLRKHRVRLRDAGSMRPALKKKEGIFGVLARINISGVTGIEYELIGMDPFCVATGQPRDATKYQTVDDAIKAATQYFDGEGYAAKQVALKDFLDSA